MTIKTGSTWAGTFVMLDATGALAAGTPSGTLYVDGVANGASVTITGSNPYKFSVTLPTLTAGQRVDMYITATISGIATAAIVASEQADTRLLSDGVTLADNAITSGTVAADAVTEIQSGLALETTLTAVKSKTDLITTGTVITVTSPVSGSTITAIRGDTLVAVLEGIGELTGYQNLWFTVKDDEADPDSASLIQIDTTTGLHYINGAAASVPGNGALEVNDEASGDVTITLEAVETAKLSPRSYHYDIQVLDSTGAISTLITGTFNVSPDYTRSIGI